MASKVNIIDEQGPGSTITLDGPNATITAGTFETFKDPQHVQVQVMVQKPTITLYGNSGTIEAGGAGTNGVLALFDNSIGALPRISLNAGTGAFVMTSQMSGPPGFHPTIGLHSDKGDLGIGGTAKMGTSCFSQRPCEVRTPPHRKRNLRSTSAPVMAASAPGAMGKTAIFCSSRQLCKNRTLRQTMAKQQFI
jgi:hypothetical protein